MFFLEIDCIQNDCVKIHKLNQWTSIQPGNFTEYCKSYYAKLFPNVNVNEPSHSSKKEGLTLTIMHLSGLCILKQLIHSEQNLNLFKKTIRVLEMGSLGLFKTFLPWKNISTYFTTLELDEVQDYVM